MKFDNTDMPEEIKFDNTDMPEEIKSHAPLSGVSGLFPIKGFGIHKVHNRFPQILRYWRPRKLTISDMPKIYKWWWFWFELK